MLSSQSALQFCSYETPLCIKVHALSSQCLCLEHKQTQLTIEVREAKFQGSEIGGRKFWWKNV